MALCPELEASSQDTTLFFAFNLLTLSFRAQRRAEQSKEWDKKNPERKRENTKRGNAKLLLRRRLSNPEWASLREYRNAKQRAKYPEIRDAKRVAERAAYRIKMQDPAFRERKNASMRASYTRDPKLRMRQILSRRVRHALSGKKKSARTLELIGCSIEQLRKYLESRFQQGKTINGVQYPDMAWDNYGTIWHIDHVRPCASFDLFDPDQQKQCFHFSNLQPLFAPENLSKGDVWR